MYVSPSEIDLPDVLVRVDALTGLVDVGDRDRFADPDRAGIRLLLADDHLEQGRLADAVRAEDTDDAVAGQAEGEVLEQAAVAEALDQMADLDDHAAQARARRDLDLLEVQLAALVGLGGHLLVPLQPGPALGLARPRAGPDPLELVLQALALLRVLGPLDLQPGRLGLQVGGVVALVGVGVATVELEDPLGHVVQEVPVVGDRDDGARVLLQVLLQPLHALRVQVVGGLIEQQQVRLGQQQPAQRDPALLPAGQAGDLGVGRRAAQRVHGLLDLAVQVPGVPVVQLLLQAAHLLEQFVGIVGRHLLGDLVVLLEELLGLGHAVLDVAEHRLGLVKLGLLVEQADGEARHQAGIAIGRLLHPRHHPEQSRLAGTVRAHDADLRAGQERQRDVVENDLVAMRLAHGTHLINELRHKVKPTGTRPLPRPLPPELP